MATVDYSFLGRSGLKVSNICLGTATFGDDKNSDILTRQTGEPDAFAILDRYVENGGNFIDTANIYSKGQSEQIIGSWLSKRGKRDDLVVATKLWGPMDESDVNCRGLSRKHILWSVEDSLKRLQTDYIDLFQIHCWDQGTPLEETVRTLDDLVRAGKVRYLGASNVVGWQLQKLVDTCKMMGLNPFISLQNQYSLLVRQVEYEMIDVCRNEGLGFLPWSPLKGGWLSGKFNRELNAPPAESRIEYATEKGIKHPIAPTFDELANEDTWRVLDALEKVAKETGKTVAQVSLRWLLQRDTVDSVVIGARTMAQLEDNMGASSGWELTQNQMEELGAASDPGCPYPYDLNRLANKGRRGKLGP